MRSGTPSARGGGAWAGASAYVAPVGGLFGYASFFAPVFLFYELAEPSTLAEGIERLAAHDSELAMWSLHF